MTYVTTKEELEAAIERKDPEIIVTGKLAKKLKPIAKLTGEMSKIGPWLAAGTGIAVLISIVTGGMSAIPMYFVQGAVAATEGPVAGGELGILITLCVTFGVVTIAGMLLNYNIEVDLGGRSIIRMSLKKEK